MATAPGTAGEGPVVRGAPQPLLHPPGAAYAMTFAAAAAAEEEGAPAPRTKKGRRRRGGAGGTLGWALNVFMKALGPMLVLLCWCLVGGVTYVYFQDIVPLNGWRLREPLGGGGVTAVGLFILFNIVFNHVGAVFTPPGGVPPGAGAFEAEVARCAELARRQHGSAAAEGASRLCAVCRLVKPPRAHHCSVCNRCVLRMDHHCPWIGNCVGHRNHRHFVLFLVYLTAGTVFVCVAGAPALVWPPEDRDLRHAHQLTASMAVLLCASSGLAVAFMAGMHLWLAATNQTTIEMYANRAAAARAAATGAPPHRNAYDLGCYWTNLGQVLGPNRPWWRWLLPTLEEFGDGMSYPERDQDDGDDVNVTKALEHIA